MFSPLDALKLLDVTAFLEVQDKLHHANFTLLNDQSHFTVGGDVEVKESYIIESVCSDYPI
jgi:hypothetical protein